jgi:prolyl-tRNA synthetase
MKYSESFIVTRKNAPSKARAVSQKLLYRGGFLRKVSAGRYAFLPLGWRVKNKIIKVIEEEMDAIGAQRMELPIMQPVELWQVTNRDEAFGELMLTSDDHYGRKYVLNATGEALMTELVGSTKPSYRDLPINVYQFLQKFRDELRPRGGLLRVREFLMKDAYNYERTEKKFMETYRDYWSAYDKVFARLELDAVAVEADNGALGGDYSHEFMVFTPEEVEELDIYLDEDEEENKMETVDVSVDKDKYKEILKIYASEPEKTLKNMIYRVDDEKFVCITLRGDYRIDFTKLKRFLDYEQIRPATADEIKSLGSFIGYVSPIGLDDEIELIVDQSVKFNKNYWDGAHKEKVFRKNVNYGRDFKVDDNMVADVREDKIYSAGGDKIVVCDRCDYKANVEKAEFTREEVNMDEEMREMKVIDQPEWVCTMDENVEHYKKPKSHFLKNVVYKDKDDRLIIAVVRGDLEANPTKIANLLDCGTLELADDEDLADMKTKSGWVHSWGHTAKDREVIYVGDIALEKSRNLIGGQKEKTTDTFNVNYGRDFECDVVGDIAAATEGSKCKHCAEGYLKEKKGIEVGHIFKYDDYYTTPHKATFVDEDGKEKPMWMGAYGIGVGRALATVVEMHNDEDGIIWPVEIAPYHVHIVSIGEDEEVNKTAQSIHDHLQKSDIEVLWDDRTEASAGVKFADADLIGIPLRIVVSGRSLKNNEVEMKRRGKDDAEMVANESKAVLEAVMKSLEM